MGSGGGRDDGDFTDLIFYGSFPEKSHYSIHTRGIGAKIRDCDVSAAEFAFSFVAKQAQFLVSITEVLFFPFHLLYYYPTRS